VEVVETEEEVGEQVLEAVAVEAVSEEEVEAEVDVGVEVAVVTLSTRCDRQQGVLCARASFPPHRAIDEQRFVPNRIRAVMASLFELAQLHNADGSGMHTFHQKHHLILDASLTFPIWAAFLRMHAYT
jgi:hypothetical protein